MSNNIRLAWDNPATRDAASVVASSEQSSNPAENIKDPAPWLSWRSKIGWTVVLNENDTIKVEENGTPRTAVIAAGYYATGSAYATAAQAAMNAMGGSAAYTVTYSGVTGKFTIANAALTTLKLIGTNFEKWAILDMGFLLSLYQGALTYVGDLPAYKGREAIMIDLGAETFADLPGGAVDVFPIFPNQNNIVPMWEQDLGQVSIAVPGGRYTNPTTLAAAVTAALNGKIPVAFVNTYICEWSSNRFEIRRTAGAKSFEIRWLTGTDASASIAGVLGYSKTADKTGATTYTADVDVNGWPPPKEVAIVGHNLESGADVDVQQSATTFIGAAFGYGPGLATSIGKLPGNRDMRLSFFSIVDARRYWRLVINDVQNPAGYTEAAVVFLGRYDEYAGWVPGREDEYEQLSQVLRTPFGAIFQEVRGQAKRIFGQLRALTRTEKLAFEAMQKSIKVGGPLLVAASAVNFPREESYYMVLEETVRFTHNDQTQEQYDSSVINFVQLVAG